MIDEQLLTLTELSKELPLVHHKRIHPSTLWRWCKRGFRGVYLEYVCMGRIIMTSHQAIWRFFKAIAEQEKEQSAQRCSRHSSGRRKRPALPQKRQQEIESAQEVLVRAGILKPSMETSHGR